MSQRCILEIIPDRVYSKRSPLVFGVRVLHGALCKGATVFLAGTDAEPIGRVTSIDIDRERVQLASVGSKPCIRIESESDSRIYFYGRHFSRLDRLAAVAYR